MSGWQKASDRETPGAAAADAALFTVKDPQETASDASNVDLDRRHSQMNERLSDEQDRQGENRYQMAVDEDYYDSLQWTEEDARELMNRGQAPLVFNKIKPTINWILGTEKRTRIDYTVLPREANDEEGAQTKKKLVKYVSDVNRLQFHRSEAFKNTTIAGLGWLEDGISTDPTEEMIFGRSENWRNMFHDSRSRELDHNKDMRYIVRSKVLDLDMACALFPNKAKALEGYSITGFERDAESVWYLGERLMTNQRDFDGAGNPVSSSLGQRGAFVASNQRDHGRREQIRVNEGWYTVPMAQKYFAYGDARGQEYDAGDEFHKYLVSKQKVPLVTTVTNQMRVMLFTEGMPLWDGPSPYKHRKFPFTPMWCYRRHKDGMPYGVIRDIRDPQEDLNKRRSKALFILSSNRVKMEKGAVDDIEDLREEAARPDGIIVTNGSKSLTFEKPTGEFTGNLEMMQNAENFIQEVSGVTSENLGQSTNATSGKAILARQEQGSVVTANIFDSMRFAVQLQGEKLVSLMEQFYSEPKVIRIVGENQPIDWVKINDEDPQTGQVLNDITASKADFVISEQDFRASLRQAAQETMTNLLQTLPPEAAMAMLDLVVDLWDLPGKEEWMQRIRKINGQRDPSKRATPEEEQAMQAQQQQQQADAQLQRDAMQADVDVKRAQAQKLAAEAQATMAEMQQGPDTNPELQSMQAELQRLTDQLQDAQTAADQLIHEAKIQADARVQAVESKLQEEKVANASKEMEIMARKDADIEKAHIAAQATIKATLITTAHNARIDILTSQLKELQAKAKEKAKPKPKTKA